MRATTNVSRKRTSKRARYIRRRRPGASGYLRLVRWSNNDSNSNCHFVVVGDNTVNSGVNATTFNLSQLAGNGELTALFDNYRITRVLYRFLIKRDPSQNPSASTASGLFPSIRWVHDFNDSTPISKAQMMQHAAMREFYFSENKQVSRWFSLKPSTLSTTYESGVTNAFSSKWGQWLDTADNTCPHYGLKFAYDGMYSGMTLQIEAKVICELKGIS